MNELYWISVLGNVNTLLAALLVLSGSALTVGGCLCIEEYCEGSWNKQRIKRVKKYAACFLLVLIAFVFTPSKKDLLFIYGVGGTIDYIQSSDEAKKLPDNCIKAANKFVESYLEEEKGDKK